MKNDYSFKLVAAVILAGVVVALWSPTRNLPASAAASTEVAQVVQPSE